MICECPICVSFQPKKEPPLCSDCGVQHFDCVPHWRVQEKKECEMKRCNGACNSGERCIYCKNLQAHCSCYEFKSDKKFCKECGGPREREVYHPSEVEEKIKEISTMYGDTWDKERKLRELVDLVRKENK